MKKKYLNERLISVLSVSENEMEEKFAFTVNVNIPFSNVNIIRDLCFECISSFAPEFNYLSFVYDRFCCNLILILIFYSVI